MNLEETMDDGYPTEETEKRVREYKGDLGGLLNEVRKVWRYADCGFWREEDGITEFFKKPCRRYFVSTGGWSGNESIVSAMESNFIFWAMTWVQTRRGGHYIFEVKAEAGNGERTVV